MKVRSVVVFAVLVGLFVFAPAAMAQEGGDPNAWTDAVCVGQAGIVFQSVNETGDGVTIALYEVIDGSVVATEDGCGSHPGKLWMLVEPWGSDSTNAEAAVVGTWQQIAEFAAANNWPNGSGWLVDESILDHPLVVSATEATGRDTMGLNPGEDQVQLARQGWVLERAEELLTEANLTPEEYCEGNEEPLSEYLCSIEAFTEVEIVAEVAEAEPVESEQAEAAVEPAEEVAEEPVEDVRFNVADCDPQDLNGGELLYPESIAAGICTYYVQVEPPQRSIDLSATHGQNYLADVSVTGFNWWLLAAIALIVLSLLSIFAWDWVISGWLAVLVGVLLTIGGLLGFLPRPWWSWLIVGATLVAAGFWDFVRDTARAAGRTVGGWFRRRGDQDDEQEDVN